MPGGTGIGDGRFTRERDQERRIQQDRAAHRFLCASPSPLPADFSTHSIKSSPVSIGPAVSMNALITSDLGTWFTSRAEGKAERPLRLH